MEKLLEIEKDENILVSSIIESPEASEYIYMPLEEDAQILVNKDVHVYIGTILAKKIKTITAPVSGVAKKIAKVDTIQGSLYAITIKNDLRETKLLKPTNKFNLKKIVKEKLENVLKVEFQINFENKNNLILNAIDDEAYVVTESFYLFLYYEGFLELIDEIARIFNISNIILAVKANNSENIKKLMECLGMYPHIKLEIIPNLYLLGQEEFLLKYLNLKKEDSIVIKTSLFYDIYNLIKRNRQKTDKLITISGDNIINPMVVRVTIGEKIKDVIDLLIKKKDDDCIFFANGLLGGKKIQIDNFIITDELDSILIMRKTKEKKAGACLNCGMCMEVCPKGLNPLLFMKKKYLEQAKKSCLNCGLCSYICPVYINFKEYLEGNKYNA